MPARYLAGAANAASSGGHRASPPDAPVSAAPWSLGSRLRAPPASTVSGGEVRVPRQRPRPGMVEALLAAVDRRGDLPLLSARIGAARSPTSAASLAGCGWLRDNLAALDVFINFAHCMNETPRVLSARARSRSASTSRPTTRSRPRSGARCGAVLVTCHFGNWDIGARTLVRFGCPFNLVMAREANETTAGLRAEGARTPAYACCSRTASVYGSFNMLRALKRNEVVAMQLDRPLGGDGARLIDFFGAPAWFQAGPIRPRASRRRAHLSGVLAPRRSAALPHRARHRAQRRAATRPSKRWTASSTSIVARVRAARPAPRRISGSSSRPTGTERVTSRRTGRRTNARGDPSDARARRAEYSATAALRNRGTTPRSSAPYPFTSRALLDWTSHGTRPGNDRPGRGVRHRCEHFR